MLRRKLHSLWRVARAIALTVVALIVAVFIVCVLRSVPTVALDAMRNADTFELLSLNPSHSQSGFHQHAVAGSTMVTDPQTRQNLISALRSGARWNFPLPSMCFSPRHGIRVTSGGQTIDLLICFECGEVKVFRGDQEIDSFMMGEGPHQTFDRVLRDAGVPIIVGWPEEPVITPPASNPQSPAP